MSGPPPHTMENEKKEISQLEEAMDKDDEDVPFWFPETCPCDPPCHDEDEWLIDEDKKDKSWCKWCCDATLRTIIFTLLFPITLMVSAISLIPSIICTCLVECCDVKSLDGPAACCYQYGLLSPCGDYNWAFGDCEMDEEAWCPSCHCNCCCNSCKQCCNCGCDDD
mmetsp:Transcript_16783/g.23347  ORF Transcript_16783/g.23347 Transcript_16783/m.23347 type:complete len:166 (+) Transcript_16783:26-523(+)